MMNPQVQKKEQRRYPRAHQALPVKFQYLDENGEPKGEILEGFTKDVARGGICIECRFGKGKGTLELISNKTKLKLIISLPPDAPPIDSVATVKWSKKVSEPGFDVYFFGVEYEQLDDAQQQMIERHVNRLRKKPKFFLYFFLLATAFIIVFTYFILVAR